MKMNGTDEVSLNLCDYTPSLILLAFWNEKEQGLVENKSLTMCLITFSFLVLYFLFFCCQFPVSIYFCEHFLEMINENTMTL